MPDVRFDGLILPKLAFESAVYPIEHYKETAIPAAAIAAHIGCSVIEGIVIYDGNGEPNLGLR